MHHVWPNREGKARQSSKGQKLHAREMAGKAIDKTDATAAPDDQAMRKKRLL